MSDWGYASGVVSLHQPVSEAIREVIRSMTRWEGHTRG